jgi:hypothetical protein
MIDLSVSFSCALSAIERTPEYHQKRIGIFWHQEAHRNLSLNIKYFTTERFKRQYDASSLSEREKIPPAYFFFLL